MGDVVGVSVFILSEKAPGIVQGFTEKLHGPFLISTVLSPVNYTVSSLDGSAVIGRFHVEQETGLQTSGQSYSYLLPQCCYRFLR